MLASGDPYFDAGVRGHIVNLAQRNAHRLAGYEIDDLVQEGYLCYLLVKNRYVGKRGKRMADGRRRRYLPPKRPDAIARRHFMKLLQRTITNRFHSIAKRQSRSTEVVAADLIAPDQPEVRFWETLFPAEPEQATAAALLQTAPDPIQQLFRFMVEELVAPPYRRFGLSRSAPRETTNQYYSRHLNLPYGFDLVGMVQKHFVG